MGGDDDGQLQALGLRPNGAEQVADERQIAGPGRLADLVLIRLREQAREHETLAIA